MPQSTCYVDECARPVLARGWCRKHYHDWYRSQCPPCTVDGCSKPGTSVGMCPMHYIRQRKHGDPLVVKHKHDGNRVDPLQRKQCLQCSDTFSPSPRCSHAQWERRQFCSLPCKNRWTAQQQSPGLKAQRQWATAWEYHRAVEDNAELSAWAERQQRRQRRVDQATKPLPGPRHWIAGVCAGPRCDAPLVFIQKGRWKDADASYCRSCRKRRWGGSHRQRARYYGVAYEPINHFEVFAADGHRCQLCHRKTKGKHPHPQSPSLDHIIPMALGGPHLRHNVQTACLDCNTKKGVSAANDQLRMDVGG